MPLVFGFALLALAVVLVVVSASSLYLERKRLLDLADGAALNAADAWAISDAVADAGGVRVEAEHRAMREAAEEYLAQIGPTDVALVAVESRDGTSATVRLRGVWRAPVSSGLLPIEVEVEVESTARSVFHVPTEPG
ncbi:pilus assembly protein TadG-related protein [Agromyces soli]|uniref:pilus assembly protein TadG-related protein n=1 Tax=Agromyces soli TaxID=659012 RepID=UPI002436739F|nr:pilus assembly protein TadG-related protein [Agromyces soli]